MAANTANIVDLFGPIGQWVMEGLTTHGEIAIFIAVLCVGEIAILTAFVLAGQGIFSPISVILISSLATLIADIFWFGIGRFFPQRIVPGIFHRAMLGPLSDFIGFVTRDKIFLSIFFLKFFLGTRIAVILYLSRRELSTIRFILYDIVGVVFYILILGFIGLVVGNWIKNIIPAYRFTVTLISIALLVGFFMFLTHHLFGRKKEAEGSADIKTK